MSNPTASPSKCKLLRGAHVHLRPVETGDLGLIAGWRNAPDNWRFFFNKFPIALSEQVPWYQQLVANKARRLFVICDDGGQPIGTIGLDHIDFVNQSAEFGNMLIGRPESQRKGFAREAAVLLIDFGFKHLNLHRLYLYAYESHAAAIRLYEQCGFQKEGILREARFADGKFQNVILMGLLRRA